MRITRVYTKTGDAGTTRLVGQQKVPKDDPRIEAYGTVDELSVALGEARQALREEIDMIRWEEAHRGEENSPLEPGSKSVDDGPVDGDGGFELELLDDHLDYLQNLLFTLGGDLATRIDDRWDKMPLIENGHIEYVEKLIDAYNATLPPLQDFILPGGGPVSLKLHVCRVVCRRAERRVQTLASAEAIGDRASPFLNRLSDLFFVLSRWVVEQIVLAGGEATEHIWDRELDAPGLPELQTPPPADEKSED